MFQQSLPLIVFLFPLAYSPGPGNMFFAANAARFGFSATIPANAGYHLATWAVTIAIGLGFAGVQGAAPQIFRALTLIGSAYVLYLAWAFLRAGTGATKAQAQPAGFGAGIMLLVLNPKAYVIIMLMFSQFLVPENASQPAQVLRIASIFTLNNLLAFVIWSLLGDRLAARFRDQADARRLNLVFGCLLAAVALWMMRG